MPQIPLNFTKNTTENINIYHEAAKAESLGEHGFNVKFTPAQKQALKNIMKEHDIKASTFLREAVDVYIEIFPFRNKIKRHGGLLKSLLSRLS